MAIKFNLVLLLALITTVSFSQNMQEGFTYLENGDYAQAEVFFFNILKDYSNNKTAQICYGRAVGLHNNPEKAETLFIKLLNNFPDDFEVKLNYGETLLWNKKFEQAKAYFKTLISEDSKSFPALLSYANTLSNLKEYQSALVYIDKALTISPRNPNALISKKYIYLGYAYQKQQLQDYNEAEALLKENLKIFNDDTDTLINLANLYLITNKLDEAKNIYNLLAKNPENLLSALNGLALITHLKGSEKKALKLSEQAFLSMGADTKPNIIQPTTERYIQALIWNKQYKKANNLIVNLLENKPDENWLLALRATLNIYKSDFKKSITDYNKILTSDSTSFDGNLGKANAKKALGLFKQAYQAAENTLKYHTNQKDATNFIKELNLNFTPFFETKTSYSFDNGNNEAVSFQNEIQFPVSLKFNVLANYNLRTTNNSVSKHKATSNDALLGFSYQLFSNITAKLKLGITSAKAENNNYSQFLTDALLSIKPFKLQTLEIGFKRELQSFNADLLDQQLVMNNFYTNYNLSTNFNLGWFTQYFYTWQNDNNSRNLLFTSLYYSILSKPSLKAGFNYQYIAFKNQVPTIYFSPKKFNAAEAFINLIKDEVVTKPKEWFYELTAATGLQYIENNSSQNTYRIQGKLGYKFTNRCLTNLFATRSNIASATASGFTYTEFGVRLKWYLFEKPIFKI